MEKPDNKKRLKEALEVLKELAPKMYEVLEEGFYVINCKKDDDVEQIESAVKIYLYAKGIDLTPRAIQLLTMFVKYGTSTKARKMISKTIKMTGGTINQNASNLKKAGVLVYPYEDSKKSIVDPNLMKLKPYVLNGAKNSNILIKYHE